MLKDQLKNIPSSPGVYLFFRQKKPIYIGKATNLKARVLSHFNSAKLDNKEAILTTESTRIKYFLTKSDFHALVLETSLISKFKPKYNLRGRDNKSFLYIKITTNDQYPKIYPVRKSQIEKKGVYFGPYSSQKVVLYLVRYLRKIFPFCTQKKITTIACFYSKIGLCNPCPNAINSIKNIQEKKIKTKQYKNNVRKVISLLEGKIEPLTNQLYQQLKSLTDAQKYEEALELRNQIFKLENLTNNKSFNFDESNELVDNIATLASLKLLLNRFFVNLKKLSRVEAIDVSNFSDSHPTGSLVVFKDGLPDKSSYRRFKLYLEKKHSDFDHIKEIVYRRFKNNWPLPQLFIVDGGRPQVKVVTQIFKMLKKDIPVIGIAKGPDRIVIGVNNFPTLKPALNNQGFNLIRYIRDESHRFARKYHLLLRKKNYIIN